MDVVVTEKNSVKEELGSCNTPLGNCTMNYVSSRPSPSICSDGFSCVISMHDGIVMYTTSTLTTTLGFPKDMWIGRSFIDFVHPKDRNTFASQITSGLAVPKNVNVQSPEHSGSTLFCRIRRYRGLATGFGVKDRVVSFMPFHLKLSFKDINEEEGKVIYLVIQATPLFSAFKSSNEVVTKAVPFVMRHVANGKLEYIDPESIPYLGYLPQDVTDKDVLQLYHPDDLDYLRQVYETIVKEGGVPRSKTYRMVTQNGNYIKLETEWSSFVNPWSRKLEFVIGKHHVIEGPMNPDVFQSLDLDKSVKFSEDEKNKIQSLKENIVRILNDVPTKPAELAKQQMSKRCQDLALFMESLMEEQPKIDDELRLEIHDQDHSYYERDSVMLGGISPHHEYNDSMSSTDTPLSYNQLNYNETLQRYFDSHQPHSYEDYNTVTGENIMGLKLPNALSGTYLSPMAQNSGDSGELTSSCESAGVMVEVGSPAPLGDYHPLRLTESLITKHNVDMEKELVKKHRENRSSSKGEREKVSNETRQKKKEHLARCNASFQPAAAGPTNADVQPHGVKRGVKQLELDTEVNKHHCLSPRQTRRRQTTSAAPTQSSPTVTTTAAGSQWPVNHVNGINTFVPGIGIPQQMPIVSPVAAVSGMFPMYYVPAAGPPMPSNLDMNMNNTNPNNSTGQFQTSAIPYMMYGQAVFGSPFVYSPISPQVSFPMQQNVLAQAMQYVNTPSALGLTNSNYEEACKSSLRMKTTKHTGSVWRKKRVDTQATSSKAEHGSGVNNNISSNNVLNRESAAHSNDSQNGNGNSAMDLSDITSSSISPKSTEAVTDSTPKDGNTKANRIVNSEETIDRTDGESSYSSFYSSFFKTESGSAEESNDAKRAGANMNGENATATYEPHQVKIARRKMEPPWMEQVCVTSELIYKYQISTKNMDEVLTSDKQRMNTLEQPSLVNEQLDQLYLDLQLEGVAARLTLEEGITSSGSSGDETCTNVSKRSRRKREYSKLVMIYEEDAPFPPPPDGEDPSSAHSAS